MFPKLKNLKIPENLRLPNYVISCTVAIPTLILTAALVIYPLNWICSAFIITKPLIFGIGLCIYLWILYHVMYNGIFKPLIAILCSLNDTDVEELG